MRFALSHDYLTQRGGAERVALALTRIFPEAPLYTTLYEPSQTYPEFSTVDIRTSFLQRLQPLQKDPRLALPLLPAAWARTRIDDAEVMIASSSGWAHAVPVPDDCIKVVYCHNPARWLYQSDEYATRRHERRALRLLSRPLRRWDQKAARTVDLYLANSRAVAERIKRIYGMTATVVHPPVCINVDGPQEPVEGMTPGFWLTVARGRSYKNVQAVIDGVKKLNDGQLAIVGTPNSTHERSTLIRWLDVVTDAQLRWLYAHARALLSVSQEDFGLTPLEANAFGTPVAVLRAGGFLDSLAEGISGAWIRRATGQAVREALENFPVFDSEIVRSHADSFSQEAFGVQVRRAVAGASVKQAASSR